MHLFPLREEGRISLNEAVYVSISVLIDHLISLESLVLHHGEVPGGREEIYSKRSVESLSDGVLGSDTELHDEVHPQPPHSGHGEPGAGKLHSQQLHRDDMSGKQNGK